MVFEPLSGAGEYHLYYLPFGGRSTHHYPEVNYLPAADEMDPTRQTLAERAPLPEADVLRFESASEHHAFTPMERPARAEDRRAMLNRHGDAALPLVFGFCEHAARGNLVVTNPQVVGGGSNNRRIRVLIGPRHL